MKSDNILTREKGKCPNTIKIYYNKIIIFGGNRMTDVITKQQNVKLNDIQENRYLIISDVINGLKTKKRAASLLNLTERQINRLIKVAETEGAAGFIHKKYWHLT